MSLLPNIPPHLRAGPDVGPPVGPGRVYSVWDWVVCGYDYFYDPAGPSDAGGWLARPAAANTKPWSKYGDPIENLLGELPAMALYLGNGEKAWGEIVVRNRATTLAGQVGLGEGQRGYKPLMDSGLSGIGDVEIGSALKKAAVSVVLGVAAYHVWKWIKNA